uniref:SMODS and SLOG-associating 2TM effector domain-containing protein n=1 Tax=viral metagenome TaxID=1070528 RepID=A0A6C0B4X8_9ZZZZ
MSETKEEPDTAPGLKWTPQIDRMLANWCDQAKSFEWMNTEAYSRYSVRSTAMSIAVNVSIALSGVANLIVGSAQLTNTVVPPSTILGCISISISIISMLEDKFDWITMANNFKQASVQWSNVSRKLEEQLAVPPGGRKDCSTFLKYIKQDITTVSATNYMIPKDIRTKCMDKFGKIPDFDVPDICGQVEHTTVYVESTSTLQVPLLSNTNNNNAVPDTNLPPGVVHPAKSA